MIEERFVCGRARSNAYLFAPHASGRCVIVDAGPGSAARIAQRVEALDLTPDAVVLTHGHPDHIWCARELSSSYGVPAYVHPADLSWFADPATGGHVPLVSLAGRLVGSLRRLRPSDLRPLEATLELAGVRFDPIHTPGHTPGSSCLRVDDVCFTGDTVFSASVGRTTYPGGDAEALRRSLTTLDALPDATRLLPGHGEATTMEQVRPLLRGLAR